MTDRRQSYKSLHSKGYGETTIDRSRFIGYAFPIRQLDDVSQHLETIRREHHSARHVCYAYRVGTGLEYTERAADDGEPARTAGYPILNLLIGQEIEDALVVVVRYFGGIKLGTGGLVRAYTEGARLAVEDAKVVEVRPEYMWEQEIPYHLHDTIIHHIGEVASLRVVETRYEATVLATLAVEWPMLQQARLFLARYLQCDPSLIAPDAATP